MGGGRHLPSHECSHHSSKLLGDMVRLRLQRKGGFDRNAVQLFEIWKDFSDHLFVLYSFFGCAIFSNTRIILHEQPYDRAVCGLQVIDFRDLFNVVVGQVQVLQPLCHVAFNGRTPTIAVLIIIIRQCFNVWCECLVLLVFVVFLRSRRGYKRGTRGVQEGCIRVREDCKHNSHRCSPSTPGHIPGTFRAHSAEDLPSLRSGCIDLSMLLLKSSVISVEQWPSMIFITASPNAAVCHMAPGLEAMASLMSARQHATPSRCLVRQV